jgi:hypothetical protein
LEPLKIKGHNGKQLENSFFEIPIRGSSKFLESIFSGDSIKKAEKVTRVIGVFLVSSMVGFSITGVLGASVAGLARLFLIVEFSNLLIFFNIRFSPVIEGYLRLIENISEFDLFDLTFENQMKNDVNNSVASKWMGKFSELCKPGWILMDVGVTGLFSGLVYFVHAILAIFGVLKRVRDRLSVVKV